MSAERRAARRLPKGLFASIFWSSSCCRFSSGLLLLSLLFAWLPGLARAQAPDPLRILVLEGPTPDWVRRVRGQVSDLPVSIATLALVVEGQPEPELLRQLGPLAEHRDAALVAWLITDRGAASAVPAANALDASPTRVGIWFARSGRFFSRPLGGAWTRLSASDRSGVLELGALSVRSAVRSLLLDPTQAEPFADLEPARPAPNVATTLPKGAASSASAANGVAAGSAASNTTAPAAATPPNAAQPGAATPTAATAAVSASAAAAAAGSAEIAARAAAAELAAVGSPPPDAVRPQDGPIVTSPGVSAVATDTHGEPSAAHGLALDLHWNAELGAVGQLPGPPAYGAFGFAAGVRAQSGAWGALLLGQLGLPVRSQLGPTEIEVLQHALLAEGQYLRWNTGSWSFGPLARAGVRWARRATVAGDPGLAASAAKWQAALRLGLGWATELRWGTRFGATLRGVLHWEPARPSYEVLTPEGDPVASAEPWAVQPSLEISGNWYW